jgi:hypothetical protein
MLLIFEDNFRETNDKIGGINTSVLGLLSDRDPIVMQNTYQVRYPERWWS